MSKRMHKKASIIKEILQGVKAKSRKLNKMKKKYSMKKMNDLPH